MHPLQWLLSALGIQQHSRILLGNEKQVQEDTRIAVIGAGIAATSVIASLAITENKSLHITVLEKEGDVGGRLLSTPHPLGYYGALENGAAYFAADDACVLDLVHRAGLKHGAEVPGSDLGYGGGLPPGFGTITRALCSSDTQEWRHVRDMFWKYGLSFWRGRKLVQSISSAWFAPDARQNPLVAFTDLDLLKPASEYFSHSHISEHLMHDILGPCTRARTYKHIGETTALCSLLATRYITRTGVIGGNQQVVRHTLNKAGIDLLVNTTVLRVRPGESRAYSLQYQHKSEQTPQETEFDIVIITSPLSTSGVQFDLPEKDFVLQDTVPYEARYVTYVSTFMPIYNSQQIDYLDVAELSDNVLTSGQRCRFDIDSIDNRMKCGPYKCLPGDELDCDTCISEDIYRIVSRTELTDWDVVGLFLPKDGPERSEGNDVNITTAMRDAGISFVHRYAWPQALPKWKEGRQRPKPVELAPGLFYTAAFEHIIASVEMSCRTGRYVAQRVVSVLAGLTEKDEV